jgi:hypothetical protein
MSPRLFTIERWAAHAPAQRYPLLLLALLLLFGLAGGITGCGGGDSAEPAAPPPGSLIADQSTAQAGDSRIGAAVLVLPLPGPVLQLDQPARVRVRLGGIVEVGAHHGAQATVTLALAEPTPTGPSTLPLTLHPLAPAPVVLGYDVWLQLPAGTHPLAARITLRAFDANGTPSAALARAEAAVDWHVVVQP